MADEGCGYADDGEEVFGLVLVTTVEPSAAGRPGHGSLDHPAMTAQSLRGLDALAGDAVADAALAEPSTQVVVVVSFVGVQFRRLAAPGPRRERMGGIPRTSGSRPWLSCMFAPEMPRASGSPLRSQIRWIFDPSLPRSVGFGPVKGPLLPPAD